MNTWNVVARAVSVSGLLLWSVNSGAATLEPNPSLPNADDVTECVRANFPETSSNQLIEIVSTDRIDGERVLRGQMLWKPSRTGESRIVLKVTEPADLAGAAFMVIERGERDDIFMYLPSMGRVRRMQGTSVQGKLWGTDFSYADIKQLQGIIHGNAKLLGRDAGRMSDETASANEPTPVDDSWTLQLLPTVVDDTGYTKFVSVIEKARCMMLRTEIYAGSENPRKVLESEAAAINKVDGRWTAHRYKIRDLANETHTVLRVLAASHDQAVDEAVFRRQTFHSTRVAPPEPAASD